MAKLTLKYTSQDEREKIIKALAAVIKINKISKVYETGKYKKVYVDVN
ncbi:hypothetical protein [Clostridium perfringens]|nr:hypothetical protein [Clostridium perfringens]MDH5085201.1 hypothetical protein [Clostridium perfringens]